MLPQGTVDAEVARLRDQGVCFCFEMALGRDVGLAELRSEFDAVFLGIGAIKTHRLDIPGEDAEGVWNAQQFLQHTQVAVSCEAVDGFAVPSLGRRVLIVGAGDTAMDAARTALRLGARDVHILYRRTREESL